MLTDDEIRNHYRHKCNTGYDPLLCVHLTYYRDPNDIKHHIHKYYHVDHIITEDRYLELIRKTNTSSINELGDMDRMEVNNVWLPEQNAQVEEAAIFWLKPTSKCKTLTDLYNVYVNKIKIMFGTGIKL